MATRMSGLFQRASEDLSEASAAAPTLGPPRSRLQVERRMLGKEGRELVASPRVKAFLEALVFDGERVPEAAKAAGINVRRARWLLTHPAVLREQRRMIDVLRSGARARNIHLAITAVDRAMEPEATAARVKVGLEAARMIEGEEGGGSARVAGLQVPIVPGYQTVIRAELLAQDPADRALDITPARADDVQDAER
jgi:hypothetical protein